MGRRMMAMAVVLGLSASAAPAAADEPGGRNCGWTLKVSGDQVNALYPDEAAKYWNAILPIPPGGAIEAKGRFPHARYLSFHTYDTQLTAIDAIADVEIKPDAGSSNPFLPGADRTVADDRRGYTVRMVNERVPAGARVPNTIYTETADGRKSTRALGGGSLTIRVYEADRGRDDTGGVRLPTLSIVAADGTRTPVGDCPAATVPDAGATQAAGNAGLGVPLPSTGLVARNPPRWAKFVNAPTSSTDNAANDVIGDAVADPLRALTRRFPEGGYAENVHNKYIYTGLSQGYGQVVVLSGKLPTTPRTLEGEPTMGVGELRYWSLCSEIQTSQYLACHNDDAIPVDDAGRYLIAVSTAASRPSNARAECGIAWLPAGPAPQTVLLLRNMLADPAFAHSVQKVKPGEEERTLADFYPRGKYFATSADVERTYGCRRDRAPAAAAALPAKRPCGSRRLLTIHLRGLGRDRLRSATVTVNGEPARVRRSGQRGLRVDLRGRPRQRVTVRVRALTRAGRRMSATRTYRTCVPRRARR